MKKTIIITAIILALSILTHFAFFGHPNETVFDEVHFGKFISGYLNHKYFFDIHPPLGKLMIAFVAKISGFKTGFDFKEIGEKYPDNYYLWLRLLPIIFGTLLPPLIFFLARELRLSLLASFAAALFIIFENALLCQSLFILLDSMLLFFGFLGLLLYLISKRKKSIWIFVLAVVSLSFSLSIKWTGLSFLGLVLIMEIASVISRSLVAPIPRDDILRLYIKFVILIFLPIAIYFSVFFLHFAILNKSGEGDAFHSKKFQKTLINNNYQNDENVKSANIFEKFAELNLEMFRSNGRIKDDHPYDSKWYTWPMMAKPIYYWNSDEEASPAKIYLLGNPIIFWGSFLGLIILMLNCLFLFEKMRQKISAVFFILVGFILNFIPFIFITRPMFLYHYLTALIFVILALCLVVDLLKKRAKILIFVLILLLALASFIFFSPLTYGLKLKPQSFQTRIWSTNWQ